MILEIESGAGAATGASTKVRVNVEPLFRVL
jgi:hypothetical protein